MVLQPCNHAEHMAAVSSSQYTHEQYNSLRATAIVLGLVAFKHFKALGGTFMGWQWAVAHTGSSRPPHGCFGREC